MGLLQRSERISRSKQCEEKACCSSPQTLVGAHLSRSPCRQCAGSAGMRATVRVETNKRNIDGSYFKVKHSSAHTTCNIMAIIHNLKSSGSLGFLW